MYSDHMYPYFLEHISRVPNAGPVAKSAKAKQIVDPPSDPAGPEWEAPRAGRSGRGKHRQHKTAYVRQFIDHPTTNQRPKGHQITLTIK